MSNAVRMMIWQSRKGMVAEEMIINREVKTITIDLKKACCSFFLLLGLAFRNLNYIHVI